MSFLLADRDPILSLILNLCARWLPLPLLLCALLITPGPPALATTEEAVLAGGCFWCLEHDLETVPGVIDVESGYSGGESTRPTYAEVSGGGTGHQESVRVRFDNTRLSYPALLRIYWRNIDPFNPKGQFCDKGDSYRAVIFPDGPDKQLQARESLEAAARELETSLSSIQVELRPFSRFWTAEPYHQNYASRNGAKYRFYRFSCGRDRRLEEIWGTRAREGGAWESS